MSTDILSDAARNRGIELMEAFDRTQLVLWGAYDDYHSKNITRAELETILAWQRHATRRIQRQIFGKDEEWI